MQLADRQLRSDSVRPTAGQAAACACRDPPATTETPRALQAAKSGAATDSPMLLQRAGHQSVLSGSVLQAHGDSPSGSISSSADGKHLTAHSHVREQYLRTNDL